MSAGAAIAPMRIRLSAAGSMSAEISPFCWRLANAGAVGDSAHRRACKAVGGELLKSCVEERASRALGIDPSLVGSRRAPSPRAAGIIDAVGEEVEGFAVGNEVLGWAMLSCCEVVTRDEALLMPYVVIAPRCL